MGIQHATARDPEIHEPKGISTAASGQVYIADGTGSGAWTALEATQAVYGSQYVDNGSELSVMLSAAADTTLTDEDDYSTAAFTWTPGAASGVTLTPPGAFLQGSAGTYKVSFSANMKATGFTDNLKIGAKVVTGGSTAEKTPETGIATFSSDSDVGLLTFDAIIVRTDSDTTPMSITFAADKACTVNMNFATFTIIRLGD